MPEPRISAFVVLTTAIALGTLYSVIFGTYLDTSDPILSSLPHPRHAESYFARKSNIFNTVFVKNGWGWTTLAFALLYFTSPKEIQTRRRVAQWVVATLVWAAFTTWFFGPALMERVLNLSGGECVIVLPSSNANGSPGVLSVPSELCRGKQRISPSSHPDIFTSTFVAPNEGWTTRPRLQKGHDVSGHIFLLTLSILFLADQLMPSLKFNGSTRGRELITIYHRAAIGFALALSALWVWMSLTTSVYWHTPHEKVSGYAIGLAGYLATRLMEKPSR